MKELIPIHKRYLVIDSPIAFTLIANNGTDEVYRPAGAWSLDLWSLLTKEYFKQYPVFTLEIEYNEEDLPEGKTIVYRQSDINLGEGLAGVNGQLVQIENLPSNLATIDKQNEIKNKIPSVNNLATIAKQNDIISAIQNMDLSNLATIDAQNDIISYLSNMDFSSLAQETMQSSIFGVLNDIKNYLPELKKKIVKLDSYNDIKQFLINNHNEVYCDILLAHFSIVNISNGYDVTSGVFKEGNTIRPHYCKSISYSEDTDKVILWGYSNINGFNDWSNTLDSSKPSRMIIEY